MKTRSITVTEARRIVSELRAPGRNAGTHGDLFLFLFYTGARISEALQLDAGDVSRDCASVTIRTLKGGPARTIPITADLRGALRRRVNLCDPAIRPNKNRIDIGSKLFPIGERTFRGRLARAARAAGVPGRISPHTLRHTFATLAHQAGASSRTVQALLGHRTIRSTETYLHTDPRDLDRAVNGLPRLR